MRTRRVLAGLALGASIFGAVAVASPAEAQRVSFCGRVRFAPRNCILVPGGMMGMSREWDITGARPMPRRNTMIAGSGVVRGVSRCIRADRRLTHVVWRRVSACPMRR